MDRLNVLQHQNQKLALQLEEKRRESRELEQRLASHEAKDQEYSHTLLCVRRLWDQLNSDVQHMCSSVIQDLGQLPQDATMSDADHKAALNLADKDPFLARLLAGADSSAVLAASEAMDDMASEFSEVEAALQARSTSSKQLLSRLLDLLRTHSTSNGTSAAVEASSTTAVQPDARISQLEKSLDVAAAQQRLLTEQHALALDRLTEAQDRVRHLEDEAADHQQALSSTQRKLLAMQHTSSQQLTPDAQGDGAGPAVRAPSGLLPAASDVFEDGATEELTALLAKRTADLDAEREAHMQTSRELTEARFRLSEESSYVSSTRAYQALAAELASVQEALAARGREMEAVMHDKEAAEARAADRNMLALREQQAAARLTELAPRLNALVAAKAEADTARTEAEAVLMRERQRLEGSRTAAELGTMVTVLQGQLQVKEQQMEQTKVPVARINACTQQIMESKAAVTAAQVECEHAKRAAAELATSMQEARKREDALQERVCDMQAFVDVLSAYCGHDGGAQELATAHAQLEALNLRCATLQSQLDTCHGQGSAAQAAERTAAERLAAAQGECVSARSQLTAAQAHVDELTTQLASARSECELYTREIEATSTAYEEMQAQNQRLLGLLADKEEEAGTLAADKLKLVATVTRLEEALEAGRAEVERLARDMADAAAMREAGEREMGRLGAELAQVREQLRGAAWRAAGLEAECRRREEAASGLSAQLDASHKAGESSRQELAEEVERSAKERHKRQRLEEENKSLTVRLGKLRKAGVAGSSGGSKEELAEEVEAMRKLLNCNVCHERQKNVIITKCCHVFCDKCIKRNLEGRNRKCPGCGCAFGQADVKQFFFT